jgi:preprotein translocase subunit SecE
VNKVTTYFQEVKSELGKILWPKKDEVIRLTLTVFLISGIVGVYLGGIDILFTKLLEYAISR